MTGCIVGWAHTKFGKLEGEDLESLIAGTAADAIRDAGIVAGRYRRDLCRQFRRLREAELSGLARARRSRAALPAGDACGERLRHRLGGDPPGPERHRRAAPLRAGRRRGEDDRRARRDDRRHPAQRLLPQGGGRHRGRLRRHFRPHRRPLLPALRRPLRGARQDRRQEPQERRREPVRAAPQRSRLRILQRRVGEEPARRRPAPAHRLLARLRRRRRASC